ncbi:hypothetical protein [Dactylosporangium sp. NPDC005555]
MNSATGPAGQQAAWNQRFELDTKPPGTPQRRNMRHHGPQHPEKGIDDD